MAIQVAMSLSCPQGYFKSQCEFCTILFVLFCDHVLCPSHFFNSVLHYSFWNDILQNNIFCFSLMQSFSYFFFFSQKTHNVVSKHYIINKRWPVAHSVYCGQQYQFTQIATSTRVVFKFSGFQPEATAGQLCTRIIQLWTDVNMKKWFMCHRL